MVRYGSKNSLERIGIQHPKQEMIDRRAPKACLGTDLTRPEFWEMAVDRVLSPVDKFVALAAAIEHSP